MEVLEFHKEMRSDHGLTNKERAGSERHQRIVLQHDANAGER